MPLDIPAFVAAWTALFKHFDAIGYIPSECTVLYPPYSPALPLPQTPAADMPLNPLILELLQLLPYPATVDDSTSFELLPRTRAICYKEEGYLRWARDPEMFYIEDLPRARQDGVIGLLSEREILLTTQLPDGWSLVLDVDASIIREYDASGGPPGPASEYLVPEDPDHPRNWPALPAVETIWSYVRRFETLEWIAFRGDTEDGIIESSSDEHPHLKRILTETYGWPVAFRREDWIKERNDVMHRVRRSDLGWGENMGWPDEL